MKKKLNGSFPIKFAISKVLIIGLMFFFIIPAGKLKAQSNKVVIGYVGGFRGLVKTDLIEAEKTNASQLRLCRY